MGGFIAKQPNGLYCRFSTIVDCPTHYNMTRESYLNNATGNVKSREDGEEILRDWIRPFDEVLERFQPHNMTQEEFDKILWKMSV
ncbi:hypothetical protein Pryu01_03042 [Paraliobacillus ryukyuensis]|uniref:Uncharacterized protein n=1 Tax=Paraliobacillus ryukyuensis TaxID=200904 RepID=A0A366DQ93_9BACI|nr:hypothetical protein [Paraliobacillus ryukyuensis]RBO92273.1 hypothetical protein DES48_11511 [Paraliobacillus ryukyuensis]